jgi:hypothetical protein
MGSCYFQDPLLLHRRRYSNRFCSCGWSLKWCNDR